MKSASGARLQPWVWLLASGVLHAWWLEVWLGLPAPARAPHADATPSQLSFDALPAREAEPMAAPQPEAVAPTRPVRRLSRASPAPSAAPATQGSDPTAAAALEGVDVAGADTAAEAQAASPAADGGEAAPPAQRKGGPTELSVWLDLPQLEHLVILRSSTALLGAIPGYRDMLRGSDIRPFMHLQRLRVRLAGASAQELTLAAVHIGGEDSVRQAAERIAAMRQRVLDWRGNSELRATAWVDGSAIDRGLAVHGGAFLIGARAGLPKLLGANAPGAQIVNFSKMRQRVMLLVTLQDSARYLPALTKCELHSLRVSVSADLHMSVSAVYESASHAAHAPACLASLPDSASELRHTRALLERAEVVAGSDRSQLNTGVTREEIDDFIDELCWSLRRALHA